MDDLVCANDLCTSSSGFPALDKVRHWIHVSETSALVYWQAGAIDQDARSAVEYGETAAYGEKTTQTTEARWAQLHRLTGLKPETTYHYRMIMVTEAGEIASADQTFTTPRHDAAIRFPGSLSGPPYKLDQDGALYLLTSDITASGTAIEITGDNITLELDGHSVTFGESSGEQVFGIIVKNIAMTTVQNGHVIQGNAAGDYSSCVETRWREAPLEVFGITTEVHRPNGYPLRLFGSAREAEIHHNHLSSMVTELESRHYPGNDLLRIEGQGPGINVHDNLLTEGCHRGINLGGDAAGAEVAYNDIRHHALYVNGYALALSADGGIDVHHNRVTSTGRGVRLSSDGATYRDNWMDLKGHMTLSDLPANTYPFKERLIELHGIKLEETGVKNAKVTGNRVRIIQLKPDADWTYVPATPLNIASYDPNANNEISNNTFIALTEYEQTRHGEYGDSGEWASAIYLVGMNKGAASSGNYSVYVHDNTFISNDLFVSASTEVDMTVRIENNTFTLAADPPPTDGHTRYRKLGSALESAIESGSNTFNGM